MTRTSYIIGDNTIYIYYVSCRSLHNNEHVGILIIIITASLERPARGKGPELELYVL